MTQEEKRPNWNNIGISSVFVGNKANSLANLVRYLHGCPVSLRQLSPIR